MNQETMQALFENTARDGDGAFAIAYALLQLADEQAATTQASHKLGVGTASTPHGAIEALGMQIEKCGDLVAGAISSLELVLHPV